MERYKRDVEKEGKKQSILLSFVSGQIVAVTSLVNECAGSSSELRENEAGFYEERQSYPVFSVYMTVGSFLNFPHLTVSFLSQQLVIIILVS